ncbi:hypothetical protein NDU88_004519 [Pleurodeles waltl]|uniref:Uncharacterized protein n=1 Tax=Pleurodeles waltl TaxID=8319 RepID=A0AAV7ME93_PLEWA|nr:hypothetical protein NDU88_004519 [Pleurodeles waltl]
MLRPLGPWRALGRAPRVEPRGRKRRPCPGLRKRPYVSGAAPGCPRGGAGVGDPRGPAGPEVRRGSGRALGPRPARGAPRTEGTTTARGRGPAARGRPRGAHTETIDGEALRSPAGRGTHREPWRALGREVPRIGGGNAAPAQEEGPCAGGTASGRPAELSVERTHGTPLKGGGTLLARGGTA